MSVVVCECCSAIALPIRECPRGDVAGFEHARGKDLWCCACGRFWKGTPEELEAAEKRVEDDQCE